MSAIRDFEDLIAWQHARDLLKAIAPDVTTAPLKNDFKLAAQIRDSADSTMANIAEGFERGRLTEFRQFLSIAKGSCGELRSHLHAAHHFGYVTADRLEQLLSQARRVGRIIGGLRSAVDRKCRMAALESKSPRTQHPVLSTQYPVPSTQYPVPQPLTKDA